MQISAASEVIQVDSAMTANAKLREGWKLLAVVPGVTLSNSGGSYVIYVLGKPTEMPQQVGMLNRR